MNLRRKVYQSEGTLDFKGDFDQTPINSIGRIAYKM